MAEEPEISLPAEERRHCPACGGRVAAKATTCLMCGASLVGEEAALEEEVERRLPRWVGSLVVTVLALVILAGGGVGFYTMLTSEPRDLTPVATRSPTPTATLIATPTQTPTATSTSTPVPPRVHQVEEDETLLGIADAYGLAVEEILALNPDVDPEGLLQVGQDLLIPAVTPSPVPTSTLSGGGSTPTAGDFSVHVIKRGETLNSIAEEYDVSVAAIRVANDLAPGGGTIRVNQSLVIPLGTPMPSPTPTVDPNATPTPIPPYAPPPLLSPPEDAVFVESDGPILLQWASVSVLGDDEWYEVILSQRGGGLVSETAHTRATAWRVPLDLLLTGNGGLSEFRWWVQVVREKRGSEGMSIYEEAGTPSEVRSFTWMKPTPTPSPSVTPTR